jgi:hypothetical protein
MVSWGIVEESNKGLEEILSQCQAVGEMREDVRGPWFWTLPPALSARVSS